MTQRIVKEFFMLIPKSMTLPKFCEAHGLNQNTVRSWRRTTNPISPQVAILDDVLHKIGYRLTIEKKDTP